MRKKWITCILSFLFPICLLTGCGTDNSQLTETYVEDLDNSSSETEKNDDKSPEVNQKEESNGKAKESRDEDDSSNASETVASVLEGDWYIYDRVKMEQDELGKVTFRGNALMDIEPDNSQEDIYGLKETLQSDDYLKIPYEYDEESQILILDYSKRIQTLEKIKCVTYSCDADAGRQTDGIYLGKTYGLWSVVWTNGEIPNE